MGFLDKAKKAIDQNADKIDKAIDQVGDAVDKKTQGKHGAKIDKAQEFLKKQTGKNSASGTEAPRTEPPRSEPPR